ncbi:hypothetical protein SAMN02982917_4213 [Azospirillum oryzae]|uniref:DUF2946 domain-containing protein n=1 Tax=Azospirillum oryzae TaxID=286727 RepID=A0A1X7GPW7_9PROT|nr:hypothetical protein SAMN02982917_4213 [Azospirillum oryzae]
MPVRVADWMRMLGGVARAMVLVMLGLLLWSDMATAACPHERPEAAAAVATHGMSHGTSHAMDANRIDHGRQAPGRPHHAVQPCCAGMACAAVAVGLPGAELASPLGSAGPKLDWAAGLLREGLGLRPDLPPPRLG